MTSLFFIRFIKVLMMTTPFLSMTMMVLALWGIGGKATYSDLKTWKQQTEVAPVEAKNYLVKETTQSHELSATGLKCPEISVEDEKTNATKKEPLPEKIDWGLVI